VCPANSLPRICLRYHHAQGKVNAAHEFSFGHVQILPRIRNKLDGPIVGYKNPFPNFLAVHELLVHRNHKLLALRLM